MQRSVTVDGLKVELDSVNSTDIEGGTAPPQPKVFVVEAPLPMGLNDHKGFILCKVGDELLYSYGPRREVIEVVAFAFEGDCQWTPVDVWKKRWDLARFVVPLGHEYFEDEEYGEWVQGDYKGIEFIPSPEKEGRRARYVRWVCTGYRQDEGYWCPWDEAGAHPCQWEDVVALVADKRGGKHPFAIAEAVTVLPEGDCTFLEGVEAVA
jgi:hypothetical protein